MAEYVIIPRSRLKNGHVVKTPAMAAEHAALAEPVSCAVNSLQQCDLPQGDTVLVCGAGPLGLMNACVARSLGARQDHPFRGQRGQAGSSRAVQLRRAGQSRPSRIWPSV